MSGREREREREPNTPLEPTTEGGKHERCFVTRGEAHSTIYFVGAAPKISGANAPCWNARFLPTLPRLRRAACFLCCSHPAPVLPEAPAAVGRRQRARAWTSATGWRPGAVRTTTDLTASGAALC